MRLHLESCVQFELSQDKKDTYGHNDGKGTGASLTGSDAGSIRTAQPGEEKALGGDIYSGYLEKSSPNKNILQFFQFLSTYLIKISLVVTRQYKFWSKMLLICIDEM